MEENKLTAKEIFVQITALQKQLAEDSQASLRHLSEAIALLDEDENGSRDAQVAEVCDVFKTRELTFLKMIEMYEKMYDDIRKEGTK